MKQQLLCLLCIVSFYDAIAQDIFPDGWEFQGAHTTLYNGNIGTAPGPEPAGLDTAVLPTANGRLVSPVLVDLDDDGDLDIVSGSQDPAGKLYYFENTGTAIAPNWVQTALPTLDAIGFSPGGNNETKSEFVDIDDDGDLDLFYGSKNDAMGTNLDDIHYYENTGTASVPNFVAATIPGILNQNVANFPSFGFVDLDNDTDYDMVTMGSDSVGYFLNIGTKSAPIFERKFHLENPWDMNAGTGILDRNWPHGDVLTTVPNFADIDADGDYDMCFGTDGGTFKWIENIGTATVADFGMYTYQNLPGDLATLDVGQFCSMTIGDVNGDGILDAVVGSFNPGYFAWLKGTSSTLGVTEEFTAVKVTVSPNPVNDLLTIQFESSQINKTQISMYTITGQMVYSSAKLMHDDKNVKIDVSQLKSGLYFLKIKSGDSKTVVKKITVN